MGYCLRREAWPTPEVLSTVFLCFLVTEEKKAMLQEIANQKGVSCRAQGWKVHLCAAQLLQLVGGWGLELPATWENMELCKTGRHSHKLSTLGSPKGAGV